MVRANDAEQRPQGRRQVFAAGGINQLCDEEVKRGVNA